MRRPGPDEWKTLISEFPESKLTQKEFCAEKDVSVSTFQYWLYKRTKLDSKFDVNSSPAFVPVEVVASPASKTRASGGLIEVALRSGDTLRFTVGTDPSYVAELLAALG
jgi:hypothetical protein